MLDPYLSIIYTRSIFFHRKAKKVGKRRASLDENALESQCSMSSNQYRVAHEKKHKTKRNLSTSSSHSTD